MDQRLKQNSVIATRENLLTTYFINRCRPLLGTFVELNLSGDMAEEQLIQISNTAFDEIERVHNSLSFHQPDSALSQLNKALIKHPKQGITLSEDLNTVLTFAATLYQKTAGYYDISIAPTLVAQQYLPNHLLAETFSTPTEFGNFSHITIQDKIIYSELPTFFDLGGIAKGYAVDRAIATLPNNVTGSINAGGDMYMIDWQSQSVKIKYANRSRALKKIIMRNKALATSASYYRHEGSLFLNTKTGHFINSKGSVSVFADCTMIADALTKVALIMPRKAAKNVLQEFNASATFINRFGLARQIN